METRRWVNQSQPQTLYLATILLYLKAVTGLLFGATLLFLYGSWLGLAGLVAMAVAAFGIANDRRWGWRLGVGVSGAAVFAGLLILAASFGALTNFWFASTFLFAVALFVLLIHPMSREYQRIWFT